MRAILVLSILAALVLGDEFLEPAPSHYLNKDHLERDASKNQFPYQVSIRYRLGPFSLHHSGGSIISDKWVLSAANCFCFLHPSDLLVTAGILLVNTEVEIPEQQNRDIHSIIIHPDYPCDGPSPINANDIALVLLELPFKLTDSVQPIAIPPQGFNPFGIGTISGWGYVKDDGNETYQLQYAELVIYSENDCEVILDNFIEEKNNPFKKPLNLCSTSVKEHKSICSGDSGGPFAQDGKVIGIVSWKIRPCNIRSPTVYAKVSAYTDWITNSTNGEVTPAK